MKMRSLGLVLVTITLTLVVERIWYAGPTELRADDAKPQATDPLAEVNDAFRAAYRQARADLLAKSGPVVILNGDSLVLLRGGKRTEVKVIPQSYHDLKAVSHIPLAIAMMLVPGCEDKLPQAKLDQLQRFRDLIVGVEKVLPNRFADDVCKCNRLVVQSCVEFIDAALKNRMVTPIDLLNLTATYESPINRNAANAARVEIDALHMQMTTWRKELGDEEWKQLRVIVIGSQMPRHANLAVQYFAKLLGEPGESERIVYAEALWEEKKALDLLGTHALDTWIGSAFFGDERRMHRDLLGDAAKEYLGKVEW